MTKYDIVREQLADMGIDCTTTQDSCLPDEYARYIAVINGRYSYAASSPLAIQKYCEDLKKVGIEADNIPLDDGFWAGVRNQ
jgi:hypothetical protein